MKTLAEEISALKKGSEALKSVGFPHKFAAQITALLGHFGTAPSFQAFSRGHLQMSVIKYIRFREKSADDTTFIAEWYGKCIIYLETMEKEFKEHKNVLDELAKLSMLLHPEKGKGPTLS